MVSYDSNGDTQDQDGDQLDEENAQPSELDDLVDHDHAVLMDDRMSVEMANGGFSTESGLITDLDGEPTNDHGEPFTDDFTEIFDDLGQEPDDETGTEVDENPQHGSE